MRKLLMLAVAATMLGTTCFGQLVYTNAPDSMAWPAGKQWVISVFGLFSNALNTAGATNTDYSGGVTGKYNNLYVDTAPASVLRAGTVPLTGGIITLGSNVALQAVRIPATGGPITFGTNVNCGGLSTVVAASGTNILGFTIRGGLITAVYTNVP